MITTLLNFKGGTGKTTITHLLGFLMAYSGLRVVMIDTDPQGHLSTLTGNIDERGYAQEGVFDLLVNGKSLHEVIVPIDTQGRGWLGLLPGGQRTQLAAVDMQLRGMDFGAFGRAIEPLKAVTDCILVDTSPSISLFTPSILQVTDHLIIPTDMGRLELDGVAKVFYTLANMAGMHDVNVLGILPTKTTPNTREYTERLGELIGLYGASMVWEDVQTTASTIWKEATDVQSTVVDYAPEHKSSTQAWAILDKVMTATGLGVRDE